MFLMHLRERNHFSARLSATVRLRFDIYTRRRQTTMSDRDRMTLDPHTPLSRVWARRRHMITKRSLARQTHPTHDAALAPALNDHSAGVDQLTQRPLLCAAALQHEKSLRGLVTPQKR